MRIARWPLLATLGILLGVALVRYLVVHPLRMSLYLLCTCLLAFGALVLLVVNFRGRPLLAAALLLLVAFAAGWSAMTWRVLARESEHSAPPLTRQKGDAGLGHTAVIYLTHGEPETYDPISWINIWDKQWPTETEHELAFRREALKLFEQDGYRKEHLSLAWMEFKQPHPREKVEEFVKLGARKVIFFSAAISAESIHSQYDIPEMVHEARVPQGFPLIDLGAWNDDPIVIRAIVEKIDAHLR